MGKSLEFLEFLTYAEFYTPLPLTNSIEQDVELENVIWLYKFRDMAQTEIFGSGPRAVKINHFFEVPIHNYFKFTAT